LVEEKDPKHWAYAPRRKPYLGEDSDRVVLRDVINKIGTDSHTEAGAAMINMAECKKHLSKMSHSGKIWGQQFQYYKYYDHSI
jgi:hypothetical protein